MNRTGKRKFSSAMITTENKIYKKDRSKRTKRVSIIKKSSPLVDISDAFSIFSSTNIISTKDGNGNDMSFFQKGKR